MTGPVLGYILSAKTPIKKARDKFCYALINLVKE